MPKQVTILGSTGVIGTQTLEVIDHLAESFEIIALVAGTNAERLAGQIIRHRPRYVAVADEATRQQLIDRLGAHRQGIEIGVGDDGLLTAANISSDIVVSAIVGAKGLLPTWGAIARGATVALANKETLVAAGDLVMSLAQSTGSRVLPVDSEHSALLQCLQTGRAHEVQRYLITASGGPFRTWTRAQMDVATAKEALKHPNWVMGRKITIDSATLMNKGLEVIEAHHLFSASYDKIEVVVHPQSVVHSLIEFRDGSLLAQLGAADMRVPIQYALTFPERRGASWPKLDLVALSSLTFESPDLSRFPSLRLAYEAGRAGGYAPCVLNAANEVAVQAFLDGRISFTELAKLVERALELHEPGTPQDLGDILDMDAWARQTTQSMVEKGGFGW